MRPNFGDDDEITITRNRETMNSDDENCRPSRNGRTPREVARQPGASWTRYRISRVEARLSESRSIVEINRMVGTHENSSGAWMHSEVIRIRIDSVIEISQKSSSTSEAGAGSARPDRQNAETPAPGPPRLRMAPISPMVGNPPGHLLPLTCRDITMVMIATAYADRGLPNVGAAADGPPFRVRHSTGVHGVSVLRDRSTRLHRQFCRLMGRKA